MEKEPKPKKQVYFIIAIGWMLLLIGIAILPICNILKDSGYGDFWWPLVGVISSITLMVVAVILVLSVYKDSFHYGFERQLKKYSKVPLKKIENLNIVSFKQELEKEFDIVDSFYRKKEYSLNLDRICYIVAFTSLVDFDNDVDYICQKIDTLNEKSRNVSAIVIFTKSQLEENDYQNVSDLGKRLYISEKIMSITGGSNKSLVPMIYDLDTESLSYFNPSRDIVYTNYRFACKKIEKICKKIQPKNK